MVRAVAEREDLLFAGYFVYCLWEVDDEGGHTRLRGTTTVRIVNGQPDPPALADAKVILGAWPKTLCKHNRS
jgi:hypothetical protein